MHYGSLVVALLGWVCILATGRLPERWGEYLVGVLRYYWRVWSFALGFTSVYPGLRVPAGYVDPGDFPCILYSAQPLRRNRLTVAFRAVLVLPRLLLLMVIYPVLLVLLLFGWWAVLITGRWPHDLRWLIIQWLRWSLQVAAFGLLVVDDHPRFEMQVLS